MEIKKNFEADLENDKSSLFLMGLLVALCGTFVVMEWSNRNAKTFGIEDVTTVSFIDEDPVPVTIQAPPPPPVVEQPKIEEPVFKKSDAATTKPIDVIGEDHPEAVTPDAQTILTTPIEIPTEVDPESNKIYRSPDKKAQYPGGLPQLRKDLASRLVYPKGAIEAGISGTVIVEFTVEKDGTVNNIIVRRSIDPLLDKEAVRVVKALTGWTPAQMGGTKNVRSIFSLPVAFTLSRN